MKSRTVEDYLALPYTIEVVHDQSGEQDGWFARVVELPGCMTQTDAFDELEEMVQDAMRAWIVTATDAGISIPVPRVAEDYSGHLTVHVPSSLHRGLAAAAQNGVSLNTFVTAALDRSLAATMTAALSVREELGDYDSTQTNTGATQ